MIVQNQVRVKNIGIYVSRMYRLQSERRCTIAIVHRHRDFGDLASTYPDLVEIILVSFKLLSRRGSSENTIDT